MSDAIAPAETGFVFGVSGAEYAQLAARAAQTLRAVAPDANIDIYTDAEVPDGIFDQVHKLEMSWFRPKFEALRRARFERVVYLDADMYFLADISDIFEVLEEFDFAACHNQRRNSDWSNTLWRRPIPAAFPQINGGLMGMRKSPGTLALIEETERALQDEKLDKDQPVLRELLFLSKLRLAILPPEYNFVEFRMAEAMNENHAAPRVLHHWRLRWHITHGTQQIHNIPGYMGPGLYEHIKRLVANDRNLGASKVVKVKPYADTGVLGGLRFSLERSRRKRWKRKGSSD
ncbi:putative nucleotide-diphospho-sugar transferase [Roseicyclus sp. F158]|uniref:Nucleotide-diphospho-sugar transferase n=1 Tax=Tropicimonas omnivorans TaxID=3075590 RepID=A0ABU3DDI5_9RHOB|nr:putative nucleotide-diphospho-sugar transferase [Roseicyclus sp. F158]MDT0681735.1 putative nucleotide-diphospho-sugar transferase [Roseicyclus sp. F158]